MNKKLLSSLLAASMICATAMATDFRAPLAAREGSLRYDFKKVERRGHKIDVWSTGYVREADKAFMKHGFDSHPFTSLIFGKEKFKISDSFQGGGKIDYGYTQNGFARLNTTYFAPRASYTERGLMLGASWSCPIWADKGRIGLRGSVPLRNVRVEKDDEMEHAEIGLQNDVIKGAARVMSINTTEEVPVYQTHIEAATDEDGKAPAPAGNAAERDVEGDEGDPQGAKVTLTGVSAYRADLLHQVKTLDSEGCVVPLFYKKSNDDVNNQIVIAGHAYSGELETLTHEATRAPFVLVKSPSDGTLSTERSGAMLFVDYEGVEEGRPNHKLVYSTEPTDFEDAVVDCIQADFNWGELNNAYVPYTSQEGPGGEEEGYADLFNDPELIKNVWVTTIHNATGAPDPVSQSRTQMIDNALMIEGKDITSFFAQNGYTFQTYQLTGIGDADIDLFYNHKFSKKLNGEAFIGLRIPTGSGDKYFGNPYRMFAGNGDHFEVKLGGKIAWETFKWLNINAKLQFSHALESKEKRMAAFEGATVKNLGPRADADVSWSYFVGDIDFTLIHPKNKTMSTTFGYELYYKTEDKISFKKKSLTNHWLGKQWQDEEGRMATDTIPGTRFGEFAMRLSNKVARQNTESIGHRAYFEGNYNFNKHLRMFVGGKYTFAGKNIPIETEGYGGFNVKF